VGCRDFCRVHDETDLPQDGLAEQATHQKHLPSVSGHISDNFAAYIPYWKHNGYWLFDSPEIINEVARHNSVDLEGTTRLRGVLDLVR